LRKIIILTLIRQIDEEASLWKISPESMEETPLPMRRKEVVPRTPKSGGKQGGREVYEIE